MDEEKININPSPSEDEGQRKRINPDGPPKKVVKGPGGITIPHVGVRPVKPLNLFGSGPYRGGSLGNFPKRK